MPLPSSAVKNMQQALHAYATTVGFAPAEPGAIDGIVGDRTVNAVVAMVPLLPVIPAEIKSIAQLGPIALASPQVMAKAKTYIASNASKIRDGIIGLAAYQVATGKTPKPSLNINPLVVGVVVNPGSVSSSAIWFYDSWKRQYRVALPAGLQGLGAAYVEVMPSATQPAGGTQVSRTTFLTQIGKWYATFWGIGAIATTVVAGGGVIVWAVKR